MAVRDLWTLGIAAAVLAGFFVFFRSRRSGVAMRATAFDHEAALAQGISARRVFAVSWAISAGLAALAGVTLASGPAALSPTIGAIALVAFPAMIVGGLDSPIGAVVGGLIIGLTQALTAGYQEDIAPWLGENFGAVMPYVVMIVILLVRPYGLFGTPRGAEGLDGAAAPQPDPPLRRRPPAVPHPGGEGVAGRADRAVAADAGVHDRPVLAVGPQLRRHRGDRRDRAQPADRLHRPGLARPRVLHRRRRLRRRRSWAATSGCRCRCGSPPRRCSARSSAR